MLWCDQTSKGVDSLATWRPSNEDLRRVLYEQNPWIEIGEVPEALSPPVERALARELWGRVHRDDPRRYQLVLGPRRVGKTTVMYQTVKRLMGVGVPRNRLWWFRLDHPLLLEFSLEELVLLALEVAGGSGEPIYVFLDEIVYARKWDLWLKTFYDQRFPIRMVATSSATAALRDRRLESGVGRWEEQFLMPYLFTELLDLAGEEVAVPGGATLLKAIETCIRDRVEVADLERLREMFALVGGFPELLIRGPLGGEDVDAVSRLLESQRVLRTDAIERAVYKDIPQSFGVDKPMALERLLYTLAGQVTGLMSPKKICSELGISQPTFDRYVSYLERAFLVFVLPNYSGREATVQKRGRKLYFADGAVRNAALQRGVAPVRNPIERGLLLENQVASHLHGLALQTQVRLFHWREGEYEVDFVYDHPDEPIAVEVASSPDHPRSGLVAFADRYPRFRDRCYLVAPGAHVLPPSKGRAGVGTLPVDLFLILVGRQAEQALAQRLS